MNKPVSIRRGAVFRIPPTGHLPLYEQRLCYLKTMQGKVLASWALLNLFSGLLMSFFTERILFYFHLMNLSWGIVNMGVALFIFYHHNHIFNKPQTNQEKWHHQIHAEKMMLLNVGLDIAFLMIGLALYQQAYSRLDTLLPALWKGFGISVLLQSLFLFVQDLLFHALHLKNRRRILDA